MLYIFSFQMFFFISEVLALSHEQNQKLSSIYRFHPSTPFKVLSQIETNLWDLRFDVLCSAPPNPITTVVTRQPITNQEIRLYFAVAVFVSLAVLICFRFRNVLTSAILLAELIAFSEN